MPLQGTLAALLTGWEKQRTLSGAATTLTPADLGSLVIVNSSGGARAVTLPPIRGDASLSPGQNAIGRGGSIVIIRAGANAVTINMGGGGTPDTFNNGQAGPFTLAADNDWAILVSNGVNTGAGDWAMISG